MYMHNITETTIQQLNKGDIKAFEAIYDAYYVYLCTLATSYIFDRQLAGEIVNDVFIGLWSHREEIKAPLTSYLTRSVQNRSLNFIRSENSQQRIQSEAHQQLINFREELIVDSATPLKLLEDNELHMLIDNAISNLPEKCKAIFKENLHNNKSYKEIALLFNITESTVRVQIKTALSKLKEELKPLLTLFF